MSNRKILCLFDVDGTLTKPRNSIDPQLEDFLQKSLKPFCSLGKLISLLTVVLLLNVIYYVFNNFIVIQSEL